MSFLEVKNKLKDYKRYITYIYNSLKYKGLKATYNYAVFHLLWASKHRKFFLSTIGRLYKTPPFVEIEVTTKCNLKCKICEHTYWKEPVREMSFKEFKRIVDQFKHLKWIGLTGIGESFMNKDFFKMLEYIKKKNIYVELYDTFYFLDEKNVKKLIELGVDKMIVSLDAATKKTYEKMRVNSNFDRVTKHIKGMFEMKRKLKKPFPQIDFHYIITKDNLKETPQFMELVNSFNPDKDTKVVYTLLLHPFKEIKHMYTKVPKGYFKKINEKAIKYNLRLGWNANVTENKEPMTECTEWIMPFIFVTGHVIPCCAGNEANQRKFQELTALGNVKKESVEAIWNSEKYKKLRKDLREGRIPVQCANCTVYQTRMKK